MLKFVGEAIILGGAPDRDNECFAKGCIFHYPPGDSLPLFNTQMETVGEVTEVTDQSGRVIIEGSVFQEHEEFYLRAERENRGLYGAVRGMVLQEIPRITNSLKPATREIQRLQVIGFMLGFMNSDSQIKPLSITLVRDETPKYDPKFEKAYDEAYGTHPRTNLVKVPALGTKVEEAKAPTLNQTIDYLEAMSQALFGRDLGSFIQILTSPDQGHGVTLPVCDEDCEHCCSPCYPESDDVPMIHGQEVTGARPRTNLR